ncbi:MAG: FAD-binding oxidoreductase [Candidatus Helarchaeota archaeon]
MWKITQITDKVSIYNELKRIVTENFVSMDDYIRYCYSKTVDLFLKGTPDYIVRPGTPEEISEIMQLANKSKIPVFPRGGGAGEMGGAKPIGDGGIVMDMTRMRKIIDIDLENHTVTAECGITWAELNNELFKKGFYTGCMGPGSGQTAVIGGSLSHNSVGGGGGAKYGSCCKNCIGLEVVLPQGDIIEVGSRCNKYVEKPFSKYGYGPDFCGLFLGDNGTLGIKTKATLRIFPKPPYRDYYTFRLKGNTAKRCARIMLEWRSKGELGLYDGFYIPEAISIAIQLEKNWPKWDNVKGAIFYTTEAFSEKELEANVEMLNQIVEKNKGVSIGREIEEGNIAKWHYEEQGHWQIYHSLWGIFGFAHPVTTECISPINRMPHMVSAIDNWAAENSEKFKKLVDTIVTSVTTKEDAETVQMLTGLLGSSAGSGEMPMAGENNIEVTGGFLTVDIPEAYDITISLWKDMFRLVIQEGCLLYMTGDIGSQSLIEYGAFRPEFYNFFKAIKKTLDPNMILSRGKYKIFEEVMK